MYYLRKWWYGDAYAQEKQNNTKRVNEHEQQ